MAAILNFRKTLKKSHAHLHRRQILTSKVDPRAVRINPLITSMAVFNLFYQLIKLLLFKNIEGKRVFRHQDLQIFGLKLSTYELFSSTGSGSETQLQVVKFFNLTVLRVNT